MSSPSNAPATRAARKQARKDAFDYVISEILETEQSDLLFKALDTNGIKSVSELVNLSKEDIDLLQASDGTNIVDVPKSAKIKLKVLKEWNYYLMTKLNTSQVDWLDKSIITIDEFEAFRNSVYDPDKPMRELVQSLKQSAGLGVSKPAAPASGGSSTGAARSSTPMAQEFRHGIKRDKSHYSVLKDEKQWNSWKRKTVATIYAHGCANILSSTYLPSTPDETVLFNEQNNFMYDVFVTILQTNMGQFYVRNHEHDRNAQAIWSDYLKYMRTSTRADLESEDLMTYLTTARLGPGWKDTTAAFITDWLDKLRQYEDLTPVGSRWDDDMKKVMLRNALDNLRVFRDIKNQESMEKALGCSTLP